MSCKSQISTLELMYSHKVCASFSFTKLELAVFHQQNSKGLGASYNATMPNLFF